MHYPLEVLHVSAMLRMFNLAPPFENSTRRANAHALRQPFTQHFSRLDVTRVLRVEGVAVAAADGPVVAAMVLAGVGALVLAIRRGVELALGTLRDIIVRQHERVEELACVVGAVAVHNVRLVERSLSLARGRALAGVVWTGVEAGANVAGDAGNGSAELDWATEVGVGRGWGVLGVAVAAGDDNVEVVLVLAAVGRHAVRDGGAPERALVVDSRRRIGAGGRGNHAGVALDVDVDAIASRGGVAVLLALDGVVRVQGIVTKVGRA